MAGGEMTWVTRDYTSHTQGELSLRAGQQVELLDRLDKTEDHLVRVRLQLMEGLVPLSCLQLPPAKTYQLSKQPDCEGRKRKTPELCPVQSAPLSLVEIRRDTLLSLVPGSMP